MRNQDLLRAINTKKVRDTDVLELCGECNKVAKKICESERLEAVEGLRAVRNKVGIVLRLVVVLFIYLV